MYIFPAVKPQGFELLVIIIDNSFRDLEDNRYQYPAYLEYNPNNYMFYDVIIEYLNNLLNQYVTPDEETWLLSNSYILQDQRF